MGKRTTTRHKEDNTFRFQTFEEKLRQISVNVNLAIRDGRGNNPDNNETYFSQEIEKWVELNRTDSFANLLCNIGTDSRTLTQVLFQKDKLAKVLLEHLENANNVASFEPAFALVIALSRDLGEEFYSNFEEFVRIIIKIVKESKNTQIIEAGFKCYAYMSKYLRRQIVKDLHQHMKMFSCFLDPKLKTYVMIFACEAFAIVAGKFARDHPEKFLKLLFGIFLKKHPEQAVGVATLLFAIFKGIGNTLKLEGQGLHFKHCMVFLNEMDNEDDVLVWTDTLYHLIQRLLNHANSENSENLIHLLEAVVLENVNEGRSVTNLLTVYVTSIEFNNCGKLTDTPSCARVLQTISDRSCEENINLLSQAVISIIESKCSSFDTDTLNLLQPTINNILGKAAYDVLEKLNRCLRSFRAYFRMFLEPIVRSFERVEMPSTMCSDATVYCLSEAILQQGGLYQLLNQEDHYLTGSVAPACFYQNQKRIVSMLNASSLQGGLWNCCNAMKDVERDIIANGIVPEKVHYWARLFLVFSRLNSKSCEACLQVCIRLLNHLLQASQLNDNVLPIIYCVFEIFVTQVSAQSSFYESIQLKELLDSIQPSVSGAVSMKSFKGWSLKILDIVVYFVNASKYEPHLLCLNEFIKKEWDLLTTNLQCGFRVIRAITLSILKSTMELSGETSNKTQEMLEKFLLLEDMNVTNNKYCSLAKSVLTECKVIIGSETYNVNLKLLCLKYTLGLMYTNYSLIWSACTEVIRNAGKQIEMTRFWCVFGKHFCENQSFVDETSDQIRLSFLPSLCAESEDFLDLITINAFSLPKASAGYTGPEELLDITQYKLNLWLSLKGQPVTKKEYTDIKELIENVIIGPSELNNEANPVKRGHTKMIIPVLQFLENCDLVNVNHELWESALKYLMYPPDIQKAAWKFLFAKRKNKLKNYKGDIDEVINSESMDPVHKFRTDAVDVSLNKQYENETEERRSLLMDILIRVLIGKERVMKGDKRTQVLRFIAGCVESDARKYLDLTVGSPQEVKRLPPKIIEIKINKMTSALRIWRYKFPNILDQIINSACDLVSASPSSMKPLSKKAFGSEEPIPDDVFEEQKKAAVKAGRICIVAFFTALPRLEMKLETINRIFDVFIWPALIDLTSTSVGSVSWILKLFLVWSTHERYHMLFTKSKDNNVEISPMWRLYDLLESTSTTFEVKKYILGIVLNLTNPPEVVDDSEEPVEEYLNCSDLPLNVNGTYKFETTESTGVNIVLLRKEVILNLFQDGQFLKRITSQSGGGGCLALISLLASFATGGAMNEKLCNVIIGTLPMCKNKEENLFNSIMAVGKLLSSSSPTDLLMKLAPSFTWVTGRRLRTVLVDAMAVLKHGENSLVFEIIAGMNAWTELAADTPNFSERQVSFENAGIFIQKNDFNLLAYTLIFYNCLYNITHEEDIGMRNSAKNVLMIMSSTLPDKVSQNQNNATNVHRLVDSIILPKLRYGIHEKNDKRFEDILLILYAFVNDCHTLHGTFRELFKLLSVEIVDGLCNIQIHLRTRAMNKLCKTLMGCVDGVGVSPAVVQAYILPLATHNLFDEDRFSKNYNELIDSSIEVLKAVMSLTPHDQYFSYLNKLLDDPKKNTRLAKQFERVLIAIMDAFHFDLKLACMPSNNKYPPTDTTLQINQKNTDTDQQTIAPTPTQSESAENVLEEDKEEFTIPNQVIHVSTTLVPQAAAVRCLGVLKSSIIPKLRKFLHFEETATHKLSRAKKSVDDDVILKIPCTIALVKLLKKIPKSEGQNGIRSIIPSITAGLRNELVSVRNTLRKTLLNVIKELGTSHLRVVIGYLKSSLQRGYQKHVLNYTVAYLLRCLESDLKANPGHVPVKEILSLCEEELYGVMQEEKDIAIIKQKTREASKSNALPILKVCSKCVSTMEQLNALISPPIKHITEKKSLKVAKASRQWLISISEGLADNSAVNYYELLNWLLEVINKNVTGKMDTTETEVGPPNKKQKFLEAPKDSKLIAVAKKRTITEGKIEGNSLLIEFSFTCLYNGLNKVGRFRDKLRSSESTCLLDSFVPNLVDGIKGSSKQVNVMSLRCATLLLEFELTHFKKPEIIDKLQRHGFVAMNNHCYRNTTDSEITTATFKFLTAFFVRFPDFKIILQDFELMLKCIQSYLTDGNCSSSALTLLKGVLQNKYRSPAIPDLMQEVFKQCITSFYQHINEGCRQAYLVYLNNYLTNPKDLYVEVQLILRQLDFEHENGRATAAEILNSLLQSIPEDCFEEVKELVFLKLLATLDKERLPKVRERLGDALKSLFQLEPKKSLVRILLKLLLLDKHVPELDTFFLIIGLLIDDPKIFSNKDMLIVLERINMVLEPTSLKNMCSKNIRITQQIKDYMIFQAVVAFKKALGRTIFDAPLWSTASQVSNQTKNIFHLLRDVYLLYEHEWVPLITVDIISTVLNKLQLTDDNVKMELASNLDSEQATCVLLQSSEDLQEILNKLWEAMRKSDREDVLAKGAYALVQLISVAARLEQKEIFVNIISSIRRSVNGEVVKNPGVTTIRTVALGCYRGIAKTSPSDAILLIVEIMTRVAVRELTDNNVPNDLKNEAEKLIVVLRDVVGHSAFNVIHAQVNDFFHKKRNMNRAKKKEAVMLHPGLVRKRTKNVKTPFSHKKKRKTK